MLGTQLTVTPDTQTATSKRQCRAEPEARTDSMYKHHHHRTTPLSAPKHNTDPKCRKNAIAVSRPPNPLARGQGSRPQQETHACKPDNKEQRKEERKEGRGKKRLPYPGQVMVHVLENHVDGAPKPVSVRSCALREACIKQRLTNQAPLLGFTT
jgi:hypothetical protein